MCSFDINFLSYEIELFIYCGIFIMIVRGGPMFVAYVDNPPPQSYIPTKLYTIICLILMKIIPITLPAKLRLTNQAKLWLPTKPNA